MLAARAAEKMKAVDSTFQRARPSLTVPNTKMIELRNRRDARQHCARREPEILGESLVGRNGALPRGEPRLVIGVDAGE